MILSATRRFQFCAGHRVRGHGNKCAHLHGHNYVALVTCEAATLDKLGMVVDFGVIKDRIGGWIDEHWDHGFLRHRQDAEAERAITEFNNSAAAQAEGVRQKVYVLDDNPTAEVMAAHLLLQANLLLHPLPITCTKVRLWETENCYADAMFTPPMDPTPTTEA